MAKRRVTLAQWVMLHELSEPFRRTTQDAWYFSRGKFRTLEVLAELGLARFVEGDVNRVGYVITDAGKRYLATNKMEPDPKGGDRG